VSAGIHEMRQTFWANIPQFWATIPHLNCVRLLITGGLRRSGRESMQIAEPDGSSSVHVTRIARVDGCPDWQPLP
jgi:hypothetical protein